MKEDYLSDFDIAMHDVREHYVRRKNVSKKLRRLLKNRKKTEYVKLAVGITDPLGNYSAHEHQLGPRILENNSISSVFALATRMASKELTVTHLPKTIYGANLPYLKISVGSEMASLLKPNSFWVGNVRTIWAHLVMKHEGDWKKANEELRLYRTDDAPSEMDYQIWREIYLSMAPNLENIQSISDSWAEEQKIKPGKLKYIWIDAVCNALYQCK